MNDRRIPRSFTFSSLVVGAFGLVLLVRLVYLYPPAPTPELLLLLIAALLSENFALELPSFSVSLAFPLIIGAIVLVGPAGGGLVAGLCFTNYQELRDRRPFQPVLFNFGQLVIAACAGGVSYGLVGGQSLWRNGAFVPMDGRHLPSTVALAIAAALVVYGANITFMAYAVPALRDQKPAVVARAMLAYLPTQLALACVGVLIAQVMAVSAIAFPLFLFPLVLARQVYQSYERMREVYLDTVRSLIGALEAKDPYTRGHSERVAVYARDLGSHLGLDARALERIERAALLHDIGKLALSSGVLAKPGKLDPCEWEAMQRHPTVGGEMIGRIPPLKALEQTVRAHHERVDGTGYPLGLSAVDIPFAARILAIADAFDAMTTKRAYRGALTRETAIAELVAGAGGQFDADLVRVFIDSGVGRPAESSMALASSGVEQPGEATLQ